jgi:hypothetical protein
VLELIKAPNVGNVTGSFTLACIATYLTPEESEMNDNF